MVAVYFVGENQANLSRRQYAAKRKMTGERAEFLNSTEIGGCLDYDSQRTVPTGSYYQTESCERCLCSATQRICHQVSCSPPKTCDGYFKRDPKHCCDICVVHVEESPNGKENLNLKLGVLTVAVFLLFTLILFAMHRIRKKRVMVSLRSFQMLRRSYSGHCGRPYSVDGSSVTIQSVAGGEATISPDGGVRLDGYSFPEAPPTYNQAIRASPRPASVSPRSATEVVGETTVVSEPPPPYPSCANAQEFSNTDLVPDEACSRCSLSETGGSVSLSESRESISTISESGDSTESECSLSCSECSCCDSGLSRDSLSSNEVRPRSEMSSVRPSWRDRQTEADREDAVSSATNNNGGDRCQGTEVAVAAEETRKKKKSRRKKLKKLFFHKRKCERSLNEERSGRTENANGAAAGCSTNGQTDVVSSV